MVNLILIEIVLNESLVQFFKQLTQKKVTN